MVDTHPGGGQNALVRYWEIGKGAARIAWGVPGDYDRCVVQLTAHVGPDFAHRLCNVMHQHVLGVPPGQEKV